MNVIDDQMKAKWNGRGMFIDGIKDQVIDFVVHVISHKLYYSIQLNNVSCIAINLGYKIVKKDHNYDLGEL